MFQDVKKFTLNLTDNFAYVSTLKQFMIAPARHAPTSMNGVAAPNMHVLGHS
jgi:hypothetical protein